MSDLNFLHIEDKPKAVVNTTLIGQIGEDFAADFLHRNGYRLICANFKVPVGRNLRNATVTGEIDLIAFDQESLCFIEVKTRSSDEFASPLAAIDLRKQRQITRTAKVYRKIFHLETIKYRYDAIAIVLKGKKAPQIELFKGFWNESKFKKKLWRDEIW